MTTSEATPLSSYSPESQGRLPAEYLFIFCEHTPEYADELAAAVADCDTVAFEYAGFETAEDRRDWEVKLTKYVSSSATDAEKTAISTRVDDAMDDDYLGAVVAQLQGSDKSIALIDMDHDSSDFETWTNYDKAQAAYVDAVSSGAASAELKSLASEFIETSLASFTAREAVMSEQLKKLGTKPSKIGVITGAVHTPLQATIAEVAKTSRTIIGPETIVVDGTETIKYDLLDEATQMLRDSKDEAISNDMLNRIILQHLLDYHEIDLGDQTPTDFVLDMPEASVTDLLTKLDTIRERDVTSGNKTHSTVGGWLLELVTEQDATTDQRR